MKPGRELDKLVAETLGCNPCWNKYLNDYSCGCHPKHFHGAWESHARLNFYSTDIAVTIGLLDKIDSRPLIIEKLTEYNYVKDVWVIMYPKNGKVISCYSKSLPHVICLVIIKGNK